MSVTPQGATDSVPPGGYVEVQFTIENVGTGTATYTLTMSCSGNETCTYLDPTSVTLGPGAYTYAYVDFTSGGALTTGTVSLTAADAYAHQSTGSYNVVSLAGPLPVVDLTPLNGDNQDMSRCAGSCFAATYAQSTVPYFSLDTPRSITLAYHGDHIGPRPFVQANVIHGGNGSNLPNAFYLKVKKANGVFITFVNGEQKLRFAALAGSYYRLAGQFDAATNGMSADSVYPLTVVVGAEYAGGNVEVATSGKVLVVDEGPSPIARGWTLAGIQRLYVQADGSGLITDGSGSAVYFLKSGSTFVAPAGEFSILAANGSTYTRAYPDSTKVAFDATGRMTQVTDPFGNATTVIYDGNGRVSQVKDPLNHAITLSYANNNLSSITDPLSRQTSVTVDGNGRLIAVTDPDGVATTFGYDAALRLSSITDRRGSTTTFGYDPQSGKLASLTDPAVPIYGQGTVSPVTVYAAWQKVSVPYGSTAGSAFTPARADTVRGSITDPGGHQTLFTVNRFGEPLQSVAPLGDTVTVVYNTNGQPLSVTDRLGVTASYGYDGTGFMTSSLVGGVQTYFRKGGWGQADSVWGSGEVRRIFLGTGGRTDSVRIASNYKIRYQYDDNTAYASYATHAREVFSWGLWSNQAQTWYTGWFGNRSKDSVPGGRVTQYLYNSYGLVNSVASSDGAWEVTTYDLVNRPDSVQDGQHPRATVYTYDSLFLRSVRDPKLQLYQIGTNALGWVTSRTDPAGATESYQYDADGLLRQATNRRGQAVTLAYDALHRRTTRTGPAITPDTMSYGGDGRTVTTSNAVATETAYLNARLQADSARTTLWIPGGGSQSYLRRYWYNGATAVLDSVRPSGGGLANFSRGYAYNVPRGTMDSIRLGTLGWTRLTYGANLALQKYQFPDAPTDTIGFDLVTAGDLAELQSGLLHDMAHYDSVGHMDELRSVVDQFTRRFAYDTVGHLRSVSYSSQVDPYCYLYDDTGWYCTPSFDSTRVLSYDEVGNRTDLGGSYTTGNRVTGFNGCSYGSDADGNVTSRACPGQNLTLGWSADGRLSSLAVAGGSTVTFQYDAGGRVVRRDVNGAPASYFLWDGDNLLAELGNDAWTEVAQYSYYPGLDRPHAFLWYPTAYYAHQDALGNVRGLGGIASYRYDERGQVLVSSGNGAGINRAQWKGALALAPEAGLYYMRARWYEPQAGRFLSEDPAGLAAGINPYLFADDDPISGADPTGLCGHPGEPACELDPLTVEAQQLRRHAEASGYGGGHDWHDPDCDAQMPYADCQAAWRGSEATPRRAPSRAALCAASAFNGILSLGIDVAAAFTGAGAGKLLGNLGDIGGGYVLPRLAGTMSGSARGAEMAAAAMAARVRESQLITGTAIFLGLHALRSQVFSEPDHGTLYRWAKRLPFLGAGMRIGEAVNVCAGWAT